MEANAQVEVHSLPHTADIQLKEVAEKLTTGECAQRSSEAVLLNYAVSRNSSIDRDSHSIGSGLVGVMAVKTM